MISRNIVFLCILTCACALPQAGEDERVSTIASRFLASFAQKDLSATMAAWSDKAPGRIASRERFRRTFAAARIRVVSSDALRTVVTGDKARSRVKVDFEIIHNRGGQPMEESGPQERVLDWVREDGEWKIWGYSPAESILAEALMAAAGQPERARLLEEQRDLFNPRLVRWLLSRATANKDQGDFKAALQFDDVAMECAVKLGDMASQGRVRRVRGDIHSDQFEGKQALAEYQTALSLTRQSKDAAGEASVHNGTATIYLRTYRYMEAKRELENCLNIARARFEDDLETTALNNLGEMYRLMGDLVHARRLFEEELRLGRQREDRNTESSGLAGLANVHAMKGEFTDALELYKQAISIDVELISKSDQARDVGNLGSALEATAQYVAAMKALEESLQLNRELDYKPGMAAATINIGVVYQDQGQYDKALAQYQAAFDLAVKVDDKKNQAIALNNKGAVYVLTNRYGKAMAAFQASAELEHQISDPPGEAVSQASMANVYALTGHPDKAIATFYKMLSEFRQADMKVEEAATLQNLGEMSQAKKDYGGAASFFQASLKLKRSIPDHLNEILTLNSLAGLYKTLGLDARSLDAAEEAARLAHEYESAAGEATANVAIGRIQQMKRRPLQARQSYRSAIEIAGQTGAAGPAIAAWVALGGVDAEEHQWQDAAAHCRTGIDLVEQIRTAEVEPSLRMGVLSENLAPYHCVIAALLAQDRKEEAFRTAESARARSLLELMGRAKLDFEKGLTATEREKLRAVEETVNSLSTTLQQTPSKDLASRRDEARRVAGDYRRQLYKLHPDLEVQRADVPPVDLKQLAPLLDGGKTAFLEYVIGEERSWMFLLKAGEPQPTVAVYPLAVRDAELQKLVRSFVGLTQAQNVAPPEARKLYQLLIAPAEKDLAGITTLGIVPDRSLWQIPFSALAPKPGHFLVESWATFYAPSLTALTTMRHMSDERRRRRGTDDLPILLVANPAASLTRGLPGLPGTEREATAIAKDRSRAKILRGPQATKPAVLAEWSHYGIVHFATHVVLDEANPMQSGIVLSPTSKQLEDSLLDAREIARQDIAPELVVLSGCQSGAGTVYSGEGVVGLSWALFAAGTPSTLLTKWKIADTATASLMPRFYQEWQKRPMISKAQALRAAQLASLKLNPYFWAPFVLIGDWQ